MILSRWHDEVVDRVGYRVLEPYFETFWLPVLGPSASWLQRRAAFHLATVDQVELDRDVLALSLGLSINEAKHAPFQRTLKRLVDFKMARWSIEGEVLEVRTTVPWLSSGQLKRLPISLQEAHRGCRHVEAVAV